MDNYEKIRVVGRGAYGTVYLCTRLVDNCEVIIKQIPVEQMTKEERQAALNEVKVLAMLDHPNIIQYIENFLEDKALMIVMEYAEGGTLFEYLQQRNGQLLEEEIILRFFVQMLLSLQHVHSKQILHRDLKTQNILLDKKKEVVKIGDFGISKVLSSKSKAYTVVGTPCYISPELCEGKPYNQKSDIWALGCVLYELITLKRAFEAQNLPALILKIMRGTFSPVPDIYSEGLRSLLLTLLHLDPVRRPSIPQILAQPLVLNALMAIYTDSGKIPCRRMLSNLPRRVNRPTNQHVSHKELEEAPCRVYAWGSGITMPSLLPLPSSDTLVTEVAAGRTQRAAVTRNGRLLLWEAPGVESLLPGTVDSPLFVARFLEGQSAVIIQHVACGDLFTACLTDRGILMTFGSGASGCLGHGNYQDVAQAKIVERLLGFEVVSVSCGSAHVMTVTNDGEVFSWGRGDAGRLGLGSEESVCSPQQAAIPSEHFPRRVVCSLDCSMLLTNDARLLCCGSNRRNKLALDRRGQEQDEALSLTVVNSPPLPSLQVKDVAMGTSHSIILTETNELFSVGSNEFGQLGVEQCVERRVERVKAVSGTITHIACGDTFTAVANADGVLTTWGNSSRERLGRSGGSRAAVIQMPSPHCPVVSLSCNHGSTLVATRPTGVVP